MYKTIEIESWPRKDLFHFFQSFDNPTWDIVADVRIEHFYNATKEVNASFFLSFLYVLTKVCNAIDALRQRIDDQGEVREYECIHPSSTILYDNGTFGFAYFNFQPDFKKFMDAAEEVFNEQKIKKNLHPKDEDLGRIYFSPIPWISFTGFRHPFKNAGNHSVPRIVFGKHFIKENVRVIPVGLTLHHGLADGYHTGLFFNQLQEELDNPQNFINTPRTV